MPTKNRNELKQRFKKNAIPTEADFANLIDSMVCQEEDGLIRAQGEALRVNAQVDGAQQALALHADPSPTSTPDWTVSLPPDPEGAASGGHHLVIRSGTADASDAAASLDPAGKLTTNDINVRAHLETQTLKVHEAIDTQAASSSQIVARDQLVIGEATFSKAEIGRLAHFYENSLSSTQPSKSRTELTGGLLLQVDNNLIPDSPARQEQHYISLGGDGNSRRGILVNQYGDRPSHGIRVDMRVPSPRIIADIPTTAGGVAASAAAVAAATTVTSASTTAATAAATIAAAAGAIPTTSIPTTTQHPCRAIVGRIMPSDGDTANFTESKTNNNLWAGWFEGNVYVQHRVQIGTNVRRSQDLYVEGNAFIKDGVQSKAADYAELFESADGTALPIGSSVALTDDGQVRLATAADTPIGIISCTPAVLGNEFSEWPQKYLYTELGEPIMEPYQAEVLRPKQDSTGAFIYDGNGDPIMVTTGDFVTRERHKQNPDYDPTQTYIPRSQRPEWCAVGLLGQLRLRRGQPIAESWVKLKDISENVELWLVK